MAYLTIEDFRAGLDRRRMSASATPGSLHVCTNAHITRGGEIEKRRAFVPKYALPPGQTLGLDGAGGNLYTFGSDASPAVPPGIIYQRLEHAANDMSRLVASEFFDGKVFAAAEYGNGDFRHFYDGVELTQFNSGSSADVEDARLVSLLTFGAKMYGTSGSVLFFSNVNEADDWVDNGNDHVGAGFKNMANQSSGSEVLTALGKYQGLMAVFARRNIQLWNIVEDDDNNALRQILSNIGTFAPRSVVSFGDIDVFFLADNGVRSLRAPANSDRAGVTNVGTPIDEELGEYLPTLSEAQRAAAVAAIEPSGGRYVIAIGARAYVFTNFPESRISAWSRYDPGVEISDMVSDDGRLWTRAGDTVYLYGGDGGEDYDNSRVEVLIPFVDGRTAATFKQFYGLDIICEGEWRIYAAFDPNRPDVETHIATVLGTTIGAPGITMEHESPVVQLRLVNEAPGPARISRVMVHYHETKAN